MRPVLIIILITLTTSCVFGQGNVHEKRMIGFGCYFTGRPTKPVEKVTELLLKKKYEKISGLLESGHGGEKILGNCFT